MSFEQEARHLGLPIPTEDEYDRLILAGFGVSPGPEFYSIAELASEVTLVYPAIEQEANYDISFFMQYEAHENMSPKNIIDYTDGIGDGYDLAVGVLTYLNFWRSQHADINGFLIDAKERLGEIPLTTQSQRERVRAVRVGNAIMDAATKETLEDSSEFAIQDASDYLFEAHYIERLIDEWMDKHTDNRPFSFNNIEADYFYKQGVGHGFANAIEMYIQSIEEAVLENATS